MFVSVLSAQHRSIAPWPSLGLDVPGIANFGAHACGVRQEAAGAQQSGTWTKATVAAWWLPGTRRLPEKFQSGRPGAEIPFRRWRPVQAGPLFDNGMTIF
jgi:hypothetical protein